VGAEQILVMDAGRIVERGTHAELLAGGGTYAQMWRMQSRNQGAAVAVDATVAHLGEGATTGGSIESAQFR
jgi:ABC-type antimicrobial peptide transport system ATPase subunit